MKAVIQGGIRLGAWAAHEDLFTLMRGRIDGVLAEASKEFQPLVGDKNVCAGTSFCIFLNCAYTRCAFEAWTKSKSESCGPKAWLDANERFWLLVLPEKEVRALLSATPPVDWTGYSEEIAAI
eukprot:2585631-Amphidinium_carterae.1